MERIKSLKIKKDDGSFYEVPLGGTVTGVKGDGELNYRTGDVSISKNDIGLSNVENTADSDKNVASAGKVSNALTIGDKTYDGSEVITIDETDIEKILKYKPSGPWELVTNPDPKNLVVENWQQNESESYYYQNVVVPNYEKNRLTIIYFNTNDNNIASDILTSGIIVVGIDKDNIQFRVVKKPTVQIDFIALLGDIVDEEVNPVLVPPSGISKQTIVNALGYTPNGPWKVSYIYLDKREAKPLGKSEGYDEYGYYYYWDVYIEGYTEKSPMFIQMNDDLNYGDYFNSHKFKADMIEDGHIRIISDTDLSDKDMGDLYFDVLIGPEVENEYFLPVFINPQGITKQNVINALGYTPVGGQGVNLLTGTKDFSGFPIRREYSDTDNIYNSFNVLHLDAGSAPSRVDFQREDIKIYRYGEQYTASFFARGTGGIQVFFYGNIHDDTIVRTAKTETSEGYSGASSDGRAEITLTGEWKLYWIHWTLATTGDLSKNKYLLFAAQPGNDAYIYAPKLEYGTVTDPVWTPAPQDVLLKGEVDGRNLWSVASQTLSKVVYSGGTYYANDGDSRSPIEFVLQQWKVYNTDLVSATSIISNGVGSYKITSVIGNNCLYLRFKNNGATSEFYVDIPNPLKVGDTFTLSFDLIDATPGACRIKNLKLERGSISTLWTPAPEDVVVRSELGKTHVSKGKELPYTWDELKNMCSTGDFKDVEVGDYKTITMKNKEIVVMEVAGINTFYNTGGQENHGRFATMNYAPVPHHIDFISRDCVQTLFQWNTTNYNGGTGESTLDDGTDQPFLTSYIKKSFLESTLLDNLPDEVNKVIIPKINLLERRAHVEGAALTTSTGWHWYNMGKLWLPSEFEVFGTNVWSCQGYGSTQAVQYPLFANSWEHRIKGRGNGGDRCNWWLCSVDSGSSTTCCNVFNTGYADHSGASNSFGVPVCFRVAAKDKL